MLREREALGVREEGELNLAPRCFTAENAATSPPLLFSVYLGGVKNRDK